MGRLKDLISTMNMLMDKAADVHVHGGQGWRLLKAKQRMAVIYELTDSYQCNIVDSFFKNKEETYYLSAFL